MDFRDILVRLQYNLNILQERVAKYGSQPPLELLNQIEDHRQAILKQAFEGRLVPQDPADEPASVLLGKIRGKKAKGKKRGR